MKTSFALFNLGGGEIILILALILILYGARSLPESAKDLGRERTDWERLANAALEKMLEFGTGLKEVQKAAHNEIEHTWINWDRWGRLIGLILVALLILTIIGILALDGNLL